MKFFSVDYSEDGEDNNRNINSQKVKQVILKKNSDEKRRPRSNFEIV